MIRILLLFPTRISSLNLTIRQGSMILPFTCPCTSYTEKKAPVKRCQIENRRFCRQPTAEVATTPDSPQPHTLRRSGALRTQLLFDSYLFSTQQHRSTFNPITTTTITPPHQQTHCLLFPNSGHIIRVFSHNLNGLVHNQSIT